MPEIVLTEEEIARVLACLRRLPIDEIHFYNKVAQYFQQQLAVRAVPPVVVNGQEVPTQD